VFGVIVLIAAFSTTNASAVNNEFLPAGTATTTLSCGGNDAVDGGVTTAILQGIGLDPVGLPATITSDPVDSPNTGDSFTMTFHWAFTLPQSLASTAVGLGTTDLSQSNGVLPMHVDSGATGADVVGNPPPQDIPLGDGSVAVNYNEGPFTGDFTRTNAIGDPIQFSPGTVTVTSTTVPGGIALQLLCTPTGTSPMVLTDQQGATPPPSSTTAPKPPPTAAPTTAATTPATGGTAGTGVEATTALARTGFHPELLYIGLFMLAAGFTLFATGRRRVASVSRRSD
jgi:hypothetical protein